MGPDHASRDADDHRSAVPCENRLHARRSLAYLYAGLFAAVLVVWSLLTRYPRVDAAAQAHRTRD